MQKERKESRVVGGREERWKYFSRGGGIFLLLLLLLPFPTAVESPAAIAAGSLEGGKDHSKWKGAEAAKGGGKGRERENGARVAAAAPISLSLSLSLFLTLSLSQGKYRHCVDEGTAPD
jgi:hypothetical protein